MKTPMKAPLKFSVKTIILNLAVDNISYSRLTINKYFENRTNAGLPLEESKELQGIQYQKDTTLLQ